MSRMTQRELLVALLAGTVLMAVSTVWAAPGENPVPGFTPEEVAAAQKNPRYAEFYKATSVAVAKLDSVACGPTQMSYPTVTYCTLTLTVQSVLRGPLKVGQQVTCGYGIMGPRRPDDNPGDHTRRKPKRKGDAEARNEEPKALDGKDSGNSARAMGMPEVGKQFLVLFNRTTNQVYPLSDELLRTARIAVAEATGAEAADAALAHAKPTEHPLYKPLKEADGVVVVGYGPGFASVSGGLTIGRVCAASLKGGLKPGEQFQAIIPTSVYAKFPDADLVILGYQLKGGQYRVTIAAEASETNLHVAAVATDTVELTPQDLIAQYSRIINPPRADLGRLPHPFSLLQGEQMRKEVGLTAEQSEQLKQIAFTSPPEIIVQIENVLTPKQVERLKKLELLQRRADILEDAQRLDQIVALTDEQKQAVQKFRGETLAKMEQLRRDGQEQILDVLTLEQTKKLRDWAPLPQFRASQR